MTQIILMLNYVSFFVFLPTNRCILVYLIAVLFFKRRFEDSRGHLGFELWRGFGTRVYSCLCPYLLSHILCKKCLLRSTLHILVTLGKKRSWTGENIELFSSGQFLEKSNERACKEDFSLLRIEWSSFQPSLGVSNIFQRNLGVVSQSEAKHK